MGIPEGVETTNICHPGHLPYLAMRSARASALYPLWPGRMAAALVITPSLATLSKYPHTLHIRQLGEDPSLLDV